MDRVRSAARALIRLAGDAFALGMWNRRKTVVKESGGPKPPAAAMEDVVEAATLMSGADASTSTSTTCEVKTSHDFPQFNVVQSPPDHHFIDSMEQVLVFSLSLLYLHTQLTYNACLYMELRA